MREILLWLSIRLKQQKHQVPLLLGQRTRNIWEYHQEMLDAEATLVESNHFNVWNNLGILIGSS